MQAVEEIKKMYRVYLLERGKKRGGSKQIDSSKTITHSPAIAEAAFWELRKNPEYEGKNLLLFLTKDGQKIATHYFMEQPGDSQFINLDAQLEIAP